MICLNLIFLIQKYEDIDNTIRCRHIVKPEIREICMNFYEIVLG